MNNTKNFKKKIKKVIKEDRKQLKKERRLKTGFYQKINLLISIILFILFTAVIIRSTIVSKSIKNYKAILLPETTELFNLDMNFEKNDSIREIDARITCYNWTGNKMANGKYPELGYVATSDRTIPFGTIIEIEGVEYEVGDRTALWVHEKFEHPTVDIYMDDCSLDFGVKYLTYKIID